MNFEAKLVTEDMRTVATVRVDARWSPELIQFGGRIFKAHDHRPGGRVWAEVHPYVVGSGGVD